jgi:hypothetical protein
MNLQDILDPCSFPLLTSLSHCCEWIGRSSICLPFLPTSDLICLVFNCSLSLFCLLIFFCLTRFFWMAWFFGRDHTFWILMLLTRFNKLFGCCVELLFFWSIRSNSPGPA